MFDGAQAEDAQTAQAYFDASAEVAPVHGSRPDPTGLTLGAGARFKT
jgi:hypothetical protein